MDEDQMYKSLKVIVILYF